MRSGLWGATAAEWVKALTLPAVWATAAGTVLVAGLISGALAASGALASANLVATTVPYLQAGPILLGALLVGSEYTGSQLRTSLAAVPNRVNLVAGKTLAFLGVASLTNAAAAAVVWAVAALPGGGVVPSIGSLAGATAYLTAMGLLAFWVAVALRSLIPPLVVMLAVVLIVSPLISSGSEHASWLPDRAGAALYLPEAEATPNGALVLLAWITAAAAAGAWRFLRADA